MKKRITDASVKALKPAEKRYRVHDDKREGFLVIVQPSGRKSFYILQTIEDRRVEAKLGDYPSMSVEGARELFDEKSAGHRDGEEIRPSDLAVAARTAAKSPENMTLAQLHQYYMDGYSKPHKKTWKEDEDVFRRYCRPLADKKISEIKRAELRQLHLLVTKNGASVRIEKPNGRKRVPGAKVQANRMLSLISSMYDFAIDEEWVENNPAWRMKKNKIAKRDRYLTADELPRWLQAVNTVRPAPRDFFKLCLYTGQRGGNVRAMRWCELDLKEGTWTIAGEDFKNGEGQLFALTNPAIEILKDRQAASNSSEWVFPASRGAKGHYSQPNTAWRAVLKKAGITNFRIHDLRHTFATYQANNNASLPTIGKSLGHKSPQATARYSHVDIDVARASSNAAVAKMIAIVAAAETDAPA